MKGSIYQEVQKVKNKWIWGLTALLTIVFICSFFEQIILENPVGSNPAPDWLILILGLLPLSGLLLIFYIKFIIQIDEDCISYQFYPFHRNPKELQWKDIDKLYIRKYNPIAEYGGWGIRTLSFKKNIAYNISGNMGLQIELKNGKKILLGTQNNDELEQVINQINHKLHPDIKI